MSKKSKSPSSIFDQVKSALETVVMSEAEQKAYKAEHGVDSVKKALRFKGKPNRSLPVILGKSGTRPNDLYQLADQRFDRARVHRIAVLKCWETNFIFDPAAFLTKIKTGQYDWSDLRRLLQKGREIRPAVIIRGVQNHYAFLSELSADEILLAEDPYQRQRKAYQAVLAEIDKPK